MKYTQKKIPTVVTPEEWKGSKVVELRRKLFNYLKENYTGMSVKNVDTKVDIQISINGCKKTAKGESMYYKKAVALLALPEILKYAEYNNFGKRKDSDNTNVIGYLNFKCKCRIDGKMENLRVAVQFQKGGKFYYNIEINKKRGGTLVRSNA